jgi:hypothetical protein
VQASLEVSIEEPAASEDAKGNEEEKKAVEEDQNKTDDEEEEESAAEENNVVAVATTVPNEIKKEDSTNSKFKCHDDMCQVTFKMYVKVHSFFLFMNVQN